METITKRLHCIHIACSTMGEEDNILETLKQYADKGIYEYEAYSDDGINNIQINTDNLKFLFWLGYMSGQKTKV